MVFYTACRGAATACVTLLHCELETPATSDSYAKAGLYGLKMVIDLPREGNGCGLLVSGELKEGAKLVKADDMVSLRRHESGGEWSDEDDDHGAVRRKKKMGLCRLSAGCIAGFLGMACMTWFAGVIFNV